MKSVQCFVGYMVVGTSMASINLFTSHHAWVKQFEILPHVVNREHRAVFFSSSPTSQKFFVLRECWWRGGHEVKRLLKGSLSGRPNHPRMLLYYDDWYKSIFFCRLAAYGLGKVSSGLILVSFIFTQWRERDRITQKRRREFFTCTVHFSMVLVG